jgi:hypothetical protein
MNPEKFWARVDMSAGPDACWPWTGYLRKDGRGSVGVGDRRLQTHRVALGSGIGLPEPAGFVLHSCDNPRCCNPAHLRVGTHADNMADMVRRGRADRRDGERNTRAKLTAAQVAEIRAVGRSATMRELAEQYGVSSWTIRDIRRGIRWVNP